MPSDALRVQRQPVEQRLRSARRACGLDVLGVGGQDLVHVSEQRIRRGMKRPVLVGGRQGGQHPRCDTRASGRVVNMLTQVGQR